MNDEKLNKLNTKQLRQHCQSNKIKGYSGLPKKELINLILGKPVNIKKHFDIVIDDLIHSKLEEKKLAELRYICKHFGIKTYKKKKPEMIDAIVINKNNPQIKKNNKTKKNKSKYSFENINLKVQKIIPKLYKLDENDWIQKYQKITLEIKEDDVSSDSFYENWPKHFKS